MDFVSLSETTTPNKVSGYRNIKRNLRWKRTVDKWQFKQFWPVCVLAVMDRTCNSNALF